MSGDHLLLVDASGYAHRAYWSSYPTYRESDGMPTWAILNFMALIWRLRGAIQADQPTHACAVFDAPGKTFRHDLFPAYKNNRPARDEELTVQMPLMRRAASVLGITPLERTGFEADDIIATLTCAAMAKGMRVTIVSSDKDFAQLVEPGVVEIVDPVAHQRITADTVRGRKFGVEPSQVPDFQALAGDAVDNIPGLEGVGSITAAGLIRAFKTVEGVVAGLDHSPHYLPPAVRVKLRRPGMLAMLQLYRTLATLRRDVPVAVMMEDLILRPILREPVMAILTELEASRRFEELFSSEPQTRRLVDAVAPQAWLDWWQEEILAPGQAVPTVPQCGFYERRIVDGGVFVPARVWREQDVDPVTGAQTGQQVLRCTVGEEARDPVQEWGRLWRSPITEEKYNFEMADRRWACLYSPTDPKAQPYKPIDLLAQRPVKCPSPQKRKP